LAKELAEFLSRDTLAIGICNGFQIMTNLGILPGGLTYNKNGLYLDRWVDLAVPPSPSGREKGRVLLLGSKELKNITPIAHGEELCYSRKTCPQCFA